jgi:chromosome segregation ATPase
MKRLVILVALAVSTQAGAAFRCVDEKGRTHIGDTPPAGCANVVMQEVTRGGIVIRTIQPSLTEEQFKARQDADARQREADKAVSEQKRKDMALLATYSTEKEFDVARDRNIEPLTGRIRNSEERLKEIDKRVATVKDEMEFYKAGKKKGGDAKERMPPGLQAELTRLDEEKKSIARQMTGYEREIGELRTKYDTDKKRWMALKGLKPSDAPVAEAKPETKAEPAKADAKPAPKK